MKQIDFNLIKKKLPKHTELIDKEEYFNSSVLIPFVKVKDEYNLLFEKRAANIRQGGEVSFPGGEFDKGADKNLQETAVRETIEELRIEKENIKVIGQLGILMVPGVVVNAFVAEVKIENSGKMNFDKTESNKDKIDTNHDKTKTNNDKTEMNQDKTETNNDKAETKYDKTEIKYDKAESNTEALNVCF